MIIIGKKKELSQDLIGQIFGKLKVVGFTTGEKGRQKCVCKCECGKTTLVNLNDLITGHKKSCGCLRSSTYDKYKDLIGQKINNWTVLEIKNINQICYASCLCNCGTVKNVRVYNLINGYSRDCGCGRKKKLSETKSVNIVGQRFGKLTAVEKLSQSDKFNRVLYRCKCDCGNEVIVSSSSLTTGKTNSCGCLLSYYNMYIDKLLDSMNVEHQSEYTVNINGHKFRFDFYLPEYNMMIEYDGQQHYVPVNFGQNNIDDIKRKFEITKQYDQLKNNYCKENNINLLRIPYWEKKNIKEIIYNRLQRLSREGFAVQQQGMQQSELTL